MTVFVFCDPPDLSFFLFFCTSYFDAPFIRAHPLIFQTCFKVFFFFVVLPKACANSGAGIIHMATGMHLGVTPQAVHHPPSYLCVPKEFPEHAAGERDTLPARSLVPLAFSCAFSLFVCRAALLLYIFFLKSPCCNCFFLLRFFPISK